MELICEDYYFYNNGMYKTISKLAPEGWFNDLNRVEPSIRIFGTRKQIDKALDTYIALTGLNLDECYEFKTEKKGSYFYDKERNNSIKKSLKIYKEKYNELSNNEALITTI